MRTKNFLIFFVLFLYRLKYASSADWASPFLITEREDVTIQLRLSDYIVLTMKEEIISPFTVAYLNEYNGNDSPTIMPFSVGQSINLGLKFEKNNSRWDMIVTKTQDYENLENRRYNFELKVGLITVTVDIMIENIFDNPPSVSYENPCIVPELTEENYESQCFYEVKDVDGMLNNAIRFEIHGNFNELFDFHLNSSLNENDVQTYNLIVKQTLYYDIRFFYSFRVTVYDIGENQFSFNIIVEVEDVPNKPPIWIRVFASAQFFEKEPQEFQAEAIDGDTGINAPICYTVEFEEDKDFSNLISIEETTGKIHVQSIDRDSLKIEVFPFYIKAYECEDETSWIKNSAVLLVEDVNDNIPLIYFNDDTKNVIEMYEETFYTLFDSSELYIVDADLGINAMYSVRLERENFSSAFNIIPQNGYQEQSFSISVLNQKLLDYENPEFQKFEITIVATESQNTSHTSEKVFQVKLLNWNDELPQFEFDEYVFNVNETITKDVIIGFVKAFDRDIDDEIEYFLNEKISEKIFINNSTGELSTILDNTFDYEQQSLFTFQVFARDKLQTRNESTHTTSTQIQINVIDVNDTPPRIILPKKFLTITENELDAIITDEIEIYDPDTSANLKIFIDWSQSVASGLDVKVEDYENCVEIFEDSLNNNQLKGTLKSNNTKEIDYEKFQVLFLTITAIDLNTEVNDNSTSAVLTIFVLDVNDNPPEFVGNTLEVKRSVIEESETDIFIGFLHAIDIDGPGNNDITFTLIPHDETTIEWVKIGNKSGELSVDKNKAIDCDIPKRFYLDYDVKISDGELENIGQISIAISDINNKIPQSKDFEVLIEIYENATNVLLKKIEAFDSDRDEPHNVLQYTINYQSNIELQRYFTINLTSGELKVKDLDENILLDRDTEPSEYSIPINIEDNLGIGARNRIEGVVRIKLLDINDNAPQMPPNLDFEMTSINEEIKKLTIIVEKFYAPDIDEGLNSEVLYDILSIEPITIDRELSKYENLFILENYDFKYTRIKTGIDLKGFSGVWSIQIRATDRGNETEGGFSQSSNSSYEIKIDPFNYNSPVITFPSKDNNIIRLDFGASEVGKTLVLLNDSKLPAFEAFDDDAGNYGDVSFVIESDPQDSFEFIKIDRHRSELHLKSAVEEKVYTIQIFAIDGGNWKSDSLTVSFAFVDKTSEPYFDNNQWRTVFTENQTGLEESIIIPEAIDPKNFGIQNEELEFEVFYYLDDSYRPDDAEFFTLNSSTRLLTLRKMLDREVVDLHSIRIIASNQDTMPALRFVSEKSMLYVEINVEDVNDNPPRFVYGNYAVGISERDNLGKNLLTLEATDPDLNDVITYNLLKSTIQVSNDELNYLKDSAFVLLNSISGVLSLNFEVQSTMSGYITFQVEAYDLVNHTDITNIKIYIVAELNRVTFQFRNTVEEVKLSDQSILIEIFSNAYDAECIIDDILPYQTSSGIVDENETNVRVHFVKDNEAITAQEIEQRSFDIAFITELVNTLNTKLSLNLKGLPTYNTGNETDKNESKMLEIILAIVSGVLCVLLIALITLYTTQRKSFNRQIKALSEQKSDIDYQKFQNVKALPNTNIYAGKESSQFNPVMINDLKEPKDFDTKSMDSNNSDDFADLSKNHIFNISSKLDSSTNA